jgi:serine phosphatase RsbU (regulator of sigma subunit)
LTTRPREAVNYRELIRRVERAVAAIGETEDLGRMVHSLIQTAIRDFRDELGLWGGRLYQRDGKDVVLVRTFADAKPLPPGLRVPRSYPPIEEAEVHGVVFLEADDPSLDPELEAHLGVQEFACISVGEGEYILAFNVAPGQQRDDILFSLGILRHAINQRLRHERLRDVFREARKIQQSILPRRLPELGDFDVASRSDPMKGVGGDYYDFIPINDKILGFAVADVTGHGLPAALQVRDIYTGLRMGMARDFKIVRTIERLNQIIHQSTLTSRFVSMVYGELELNGNFIYVNAGHPPPLFFRADGSWEELAEGGPVLGPLPDATYERGFVRLRPGDVLVLYTDGIIEARGRVATADGQESKLEEYGVERLRRTVRNRQKEGAQAVVDAIFADLDAFGSDFPVEDDRTVTVIFYPEAVKP